MSHPVRHPWLLAVCRLFLYTGAAAGVAVLGGVAVVLLGVLFVVSTLLLLLVGDVNLFGVVATGGLGLGVLATLALLLVSAARRVDRAVRAAARVPTPMERLHESYVAGAIDESELERRLDHLLTVESSGDGNPVAPDVAPRRTEPPRHVDVTTVESGRRTVNTPATER